MIVCDCPEEARLFPAELELLFSFACVPAVALGGAVVFRGTRPVCRGMGDDQILKYLHCQQCHRACIDTLLFFFLGEFIRVRRCICGKRIP